MAKIIGGIATTHVPSIGKAIAEKLGVTFRVADLAAEYRRSRGATDDGSGDVVQKAGQDENHEQQHEPAFPVVGQEAGQHLRRAAVVKMPGQQREPHQQSE